MPRGRPSCKARASAKAAVPAIEAIVEAEAAEAAPSPRVSAKAPKTPKASAKAVASPAKSPKEIVESPAKLYDMAFEEGDEVMAKWPGTALFFKSKVTYVRTDDNEYDIQFEDGTVYTLKAISYN